MKKVVTTIFVSVLFIFCIQTSFAIETRHNVLGVPKIVAREYIVSPAECMAKLPAGASKRSAWICHFKDDQAPKAFSLNPAYETKSSQLIPSTDIFMGIDSYPSGGSVTFQTHPSHGRKIDLKEIRDIIQQLSLNPQYKFIFRGTYLEIQDGH